MCSSDLLADTLRVILAASLAEDGGHPGAWLFEVARAIAMVLPPASGDCPSIFLAATYPASLSNQSVLAIPTGSPPAYRMQQVEKHLFSVLPELMTDRVKLELQHGSKKNAQAAGQVGPDRAG